MSRVYRSRHRAFRVVDSPTLAACRCDGPFTAICPKHEGEAYAAYGAKHKARRIEVRPILRALSGGVR